MASKFINYKKLKELREAAHNGNPQAKNIMDKYMDKNPDMESIDRLIDEYYRGVPTQPVQVEPIVQPEAGQPVEEVAQTVEEKAETDVVEPKPEEQLAEAGVDVVPAPEQPIEPVDISADLDRELDGLIDNDDFDDPSFNDFLSNKRKDATRARKNAEYFKAFDQGGRESYLAKKKDEFAHGFDGRRRGIERGLNDMNASLDIYNQFITDAPDDENEIDVEVAGKAYDDFTGDEGVMSAFGRSWDGQDNEVVKQKLLELVQTYGKKNVVAAMNTLREDGHAWAMFSNGKIDNAINNYGKSLDSLLK